MVWWSVVGWNNYLHCNARCHSIQGMFDHRVRIVKISMLLPFVIYLTQSCSPFQYMDKVVGHYDTWLNGDLVHLYASCSICWSYVALGHLPRIRRHRSCSFWQCKLLAFYPTRSFARQHSRLHLEIVSVTLFSLFGCCHLISVACPLTISFRSTATRECIDHKCTTLYKKFKNLICQITDLEWTASVKLSTKFARFSV